MLLQKIGLWNISSLSLDIAFIRMTDKKSFILTAKHDAKIHLSSYPKPSDNERYCLGHTEFVSHIKLIDNNHLLSASGDGKCILVFVKT